MTGGCRRLGAVIAQRLGERGWDLALHCHSAAAPDPALTAALDGAGAAWTVTQADFTDPRTAETFVQDVAARWRRVPRLLVNSASRFGQDTLATTGAEALMTHYAVNCAAPTLLTAGFAALSSPDTPDGVRAVVNVLDQRIEQPHGDQLGYTLSKIALAGATRIAARVLAPAIRVNAVAPGLTLPTADYDAALLDRLARAMPLGRLPDPGEIADAILYLAAAASVTGQVIFVDGGARLESWSGDFVGG